MSKIDKLETLAKGNVSSWRERVRKKKENSGWLKRSRDIALDVLTILDAKQLSKNDFSRMLEVSPQQVSKLLRGDANMTLSTINKIELVLGRSLIEVVDPIDLENEYIGEVYFKNIGHFDENTIMSYIKSNNSLTCAA